MMVGFYESIAACMNWREISENCSLSVCSQSMPRMTSWPTVRHLSCILDLEVYCQVLYVRELHIGEDLPICINVFLRHVVNYIWDSKLMEGMIRGLLNEEFKHIREDGKNFGLYL